MKKIRHSGIRILQAVGMFQPFVGYVGNGVGRRSHLIAMARARNNARRFPGADDWMEVE